MRTLLIISIIYINEILLYCICRLACSQYKTETILNEQCSYLLRLSLQLSRSRGRETDIQKIILSNLQMSVVAYVVVLSQYLKILRQHYNILRPHSNFDIIQFTILYIFVLFFSFKFIKKIIITYKICIDMGNECMYYVH